MKAILMSFQPQWAMKIANKEKLFEIRKRFPLNYVGWVYMYVTKPKRRYRIGSIGFFSDELYRTPKGEIKFGTSVELMAYDDYDKNNFLSGKVIARFWCDKVKEIGYGEIIIPDGYNDYDGNWVDCTKNYGHGYFISNGELKKSCLTYEEFENYGKGKSLYAIHITRLEIFDKPKELGEFHKPKCKHCGDMYECMLNIYKHGCDYTEFDTNPDGSINVVNCLKPKEPLTRAFQSWGYVEVVE